MDRDEMKAFLASYLEANWERVAALEDPAVVDLIEITMDAFADLTSANNQRLEQQFRELVKAGVAELVPEIL